MQTNGTLMMKKWLIALSIALGPVLTWAGNFNIDARTEAMGGAGTVTASFVSAGFYNPALLALEPKANIAILFPALGVQGRDPDNLLDSLNDFASIYNTFKTAPGNTNNQTNTVNALKNIQNKVAYIRGGAAGAVSISTSMISGSLFVKGYTEQIVIPDISNSDILAIEAGNTAVLQSNARILAFGIIDLGLALGGSIELAGQQIAIGITPKTQKLYTYHYEVAINNFNADEWNSNSNRTEKSMFNLDVGVAWERGPYRVGFVGKNLISQDLTTALITRIYTYSLEPLYTLGTGVVTDFFTVTMDIDLNKQRRFSATTGPEIKDDTQFVRLGTEFNAWGQAQLRLGYIKDLEDTFDGGITLGIGLSPFNTVRLDLAAQLIDSNSFGASAQLSFTF